MSRHELFAPIEPFETGRMERSEWLKQVYEAACRLAEKHGPGLRAAMESGDADGSLAGRIASTAAEVIAAEREIWPFIHFSRHSEPAGDEWRGAPSFEGAVIRVAVWALSGDIRDMLNELAGGRLKNLLAGEGAEGETPPPPPPGGET